MAAPPFNTQRVAGGLVLAVVLGGCAEEREGPPPTSVLLVTLDTTRADALDCDGTSRPVTPALCALAREAIRFPRAYTVAPLTLPAHASLLTGLYPPRHGLRDNGLAALAPAATTLAERARESGLATAAFVSTAVLDRGYGLDQGFDVYDQPPPGVRTLDDPYLERPAADTAEALCTWLAGLAPGRGFLAWLHLYDPHLPYEPPPVHLRQAGGDAYLGEVAYADRAVGTVLEALARTGRDASTWVVVTADHGEALGEHGEPSHGALCYEATMRVPLLFRPPAGVEVEPGSARLASLVDVFPTTLSFLGLAPSPDVDGVDLFATDEAARRAQRERGVYLESFSGWLHYGWSPLAGWVDAAGKYLHSSRPELYLPDDPAERHNAAREQHAMCARARERIAAVYARPALAPVGVDAPDDRLQAALRALGYVGIAFDPASLPSPLEPSDRPSPLERRVELEPLHRANALVDAGRPADALAPLDRILAANPAHRLALDLRAICRMHVGRFEEAEDDLRRRLELAPERADTHLNLALCFERRGALEEARRHVAAAERLAPGLPEVVALRERLAAAEAPR